MPGDKNWLPVEDAAAEGRDVFNSLRVLSARLARLMTLCAWRYRTLEAVAREKPVPLSTLRPTAELPLDTN